MALPLRDLAVDQPPIKTPVSAPDRGDMRATVKGTASAPQTLRDALRARFEALPTSRVKDFDVPGYDGLLVARYRRMTTAEVTALTEHLPDVDPNDRESVVRAAVCLNADFLCAACAELFGRKDGELQPLSDDGVPMRYDQSFAAMMGFDVTPEQGAREVLMRTLDHNELALKRHADDVDEWMTSLRPALDKDTVGKSPRTTA